MLLRGSILDEVKHMRKLNSQRVGFLGDRTRQEVRFLRDWILEEVSFLVS